jgi:hypothetical protein
MAKQKRAYIIILVSLFIVYVGVEIFAPKEIDWSLKFDKDSKDPYGCYVLRQQLAQLVTGISVTENNDDFYRTLGDSQPQSSSLCIITNAFNPDATDLKSLLQYVEKGNFAFISAQNFSSLVGDTLSIETTWHFMESVDAANRLKLQLVNDKIAKPNTFSYPQTASYYFSRVDTAATTVLETDSLGRVTYIKAKFGQGYFFLHANPLVLTNYHILYSSSKYPARCLAYLADRPLIWDEYYKPGNNRTRGLSPLRYMLAQQSLRYAYVLFVIAWVIFVLFMGKRKQRMVPVYDAPKNQTLDFIETVGQLYYNQRNNGDVVNKKIAHFADYVHSVFYLKFRPEDATFRKDFAGKANIPIKRVDKLFDSLIKLKTSGNVSDAQLMAFIAEIDHFQYQNH